jgi:hypothetical protein
MRLPWRNSGHQSRGVKLWVVVYPRQRYLTRYSTTTFQHKVTDTKQYCCEQRRSAPLLTGGYRYSATPQSAQTNLSANLFQFNDLIGTGTTTRPRVSDFSDPRAGASILMGLRSAPLVLALKHKQQFDGAMGEMVTAAGKGCGGRQRRNRGTAETRGARHGDSRRQQQQELGGTATTAADGTNRSAGSGVSAFIRSPMKPRHRRRGRAKAVE